MPGADEMESQQVATSARPEDAAGRPPVSFRLSGARPQAPLDAPPFHEWLAPDARPWTRFYRTGAGYLLRFPGYADFEISRDGHDVAGWAVDGVPDETIDHLWHNQVLPLALSKSGRVVLHASAIETSGHAIAFVGPSGHGKSTLAVAFARDGIPCLADDGLLLDAEDGALWTVPGHPSIRLWEDSERALVEDGAAKAPALAFTPKERFLASDRIAFSQRRRRLAHLYLLGDPAEDAALDAPHFETIAAGSAVVELVKNSFLLETEERDDIARHFAQLSEVVARTPVHRLRYPRRFDALPAVTLAILAHARALDSRPSTRGDSDGWAGGAHS